MFSIQYRVIRNTKYNRNFIEVADISSVMAGREISPCFVRYLLQATVGWDGQFAVSRLTSWPDWRLETATELK